jgi:uncharacterized protein YceK
MKTLAILCLLLTGCASAIPHDSYIQSSSIIYKTNQYGETQPHNGIYRIIGNQIYQADSVGNIMYHKNSLKRGK